MRPAADITTHNWRHCLRSLLMPPCMATRRARVGRRRRDPCGAGGSSSPCLIPGGDGSVVIGEARGHPRLMAGVIQAGLTLQAREEGCTIRPQVELCG